MEFEQYFIHSCLESSVKQAKQELEKSREKIHNWKESGNEIPFAGQFNRKIINTYSVLN